MPLTRGQITALEVLATERDPESYVAGSTPLNRDHTRFSTDIDIFHDREERVAAAASADAARRELRDIVDLMAIDETILPLGAVIWAAVEKAPGYTPEGLIAEIRRNSLHPVEEWRRLRSSEPIDPDKTMQRLRAALNEAEAFVLRMPTAKAGRLFLKDGKAVQPDPDCLGDYVEHEGKRRGHWPSSPEIAAAMMERYKGGA